MNKQKKEQNLSKSQDGGYTIIESLVAMIVVSVLMIAIAPVMAFSVATRVQARRTELATQAARAYIDALRTGSLRPNDPTSLPGFPITRVPDGQKVATASVPGNTTGLYCVNLDGTANCETSSSKDFYVQGAWQVPTSVTLTNANDPTPVGYELMVRVYRADSFAGVTLNPTPSQGKKQSVVGGLGDRTMPVVEMTTEIPPTTNGGSSAYRSLCSRISGSNSCQ
ncbi:MAG: type II secretion system protein [Microcoleus sp. PH2017_15_JOR_U_A]|uniref:hormogonium polysaccharide secretion pseudopilin HpsB n=1 Tax=Microcoleus sp. PH2017_15_JOR_U_A TaxID=2798826 RepID=UPI001DEDF480|nr:hormogonium polysaccharide secretion pseudopilin HpsB [Microcoleus sp. PH2017_15_JOR_U_A]MCC3497439.1 type II secretion system protein [Microcoleus sp. PH2017_15_JOR_U_A]